MTTSTASNKYLTSVARIDKVLRSNEIVVRMQVVDVASGLIGFKRLNHLL